METFVRASSPPAERERFLIFMRILFKCLDDFDGDWHLRLRVRAIFRECTNNNWDGHPDYAPLVNCIRQRLRGVVGDVHWNQADLYLRHFLTMRSKARRVGTKGGLSQDFKVKKSGNLSRSEIPVKTYD